VSLQPIPVITGDTSAFWEGGAEGKLNIYRCESCRTWFHPPAPVCPECLSLGVGPEVASGQATVKGFSVNVQPWVPNMVVPYAVAVVALNDAAPVQLTTRLVDVRPEDVTIGMAVEVVFEQAEDVWLPLFRPSQSTTDQSVTDQSVTTTGVSA
jgi:uncharacterized protein